MVGIHFVVLWQASQLRVVTKCDAIFPEAVVPLWQVAQVPGTTLVWLNVAGFQAVVLWQLSQASTVGRCVAGLPVALVPLWQVPQVPAATRGAGVQRESEPVGREETDKVLRSLGWI